MKLFGHPIHIILIHFPSALFPLDLFFSCLARYFAMPELNYVSACMIMAGAAFGWLALLTGLFDIAHIAQKQPGSLRKALIHGGINTMVLIVYTVLALIIYKKWPAFTYDSFPVLISKFISVAALIIGNFLGAELILKDKVLEKS